MEKIHSQTIKWIFSTDNSAITDDQKEKLISSLFGIKNFKIESIITEYKNIDITLKSKNTIICIENKLKSSEHSEQLDKYQKYITGKYQDFKHEFFFLTLIGEKSNLENWINITYETILNNLKNLQIKDNIDGLILKEYIKTLEKFDDVIKDFLEFPEKYKNVFLDGSKTKISKLENGNTGNQKFISDNQLETIFQKLYFRKTAQKLKLNPKDYYITETHGNAIFGIFIEKFKIDGYEVNFGFDFQKGTFKTFCLGENYSNSKPESIPLEISSILESIKGNNKYGYNRFNRPKTRAQYSLTKGKRDFIGMKIDDFAEIYYKELELSRKLIQDEIIKTLANTVQN